MRIVYAHMGGGLFFYELMPEGARTLANVCYDTAAVPYLYRSPVYEVALRAAPGKIIFGSDYALLSPARYLRDTEGMQPELRAALFAKNARQVLGQGVLPQLEPEGGGK